MTPLTGLVHPWWQGHTAAHIYGDCPVRAQERSCRPGVGWLNPYGGGVCTVCLRRHDAHWDDDLGDEADPFAGVIGASSPGPDAARWTP